MSLSSLSERAAPEMEVGGWGAVVWWLGWRFGVGWSVGWGRGGAIVRGACRRLCSCCCCVC